MNKEMSGSKEQAIYDAVIALFKEGADLSSLTVSQITAKAGIRAFRDFLKSIGMPQTLAELGGKEEDIPYLAHTASYGNGNGGTLGGFVVLKEKDIENIYRLTI